jgi:hypothetical protein
MRFSRTSMTGWQLLRQHISRAPIGAKPLPKINGVNGYWRDSLRNSLVKQLDHVQNLLIRMMQFRACAHLQQAARI